MKIATFNINDVNKRLNNLLTWLSKTTPDVVCLQELKAEHKAFPERPLKSLGYEAVWEGERSWNGVAILSRHGSPVLTRSSLPGNAEDRQARYIEAAVQGVLITSIYLPNGNPQPGPKFDYMAERYVHPSHEAGIDALERMPHVKELSAAMEQKTGSRTG